MASGSLKQLQEKYVKIWPLSNWYKNSQTSTVNCQQSTKHANKTCYLTRMKILKICNKLSISYKSHSAPQCKILLQKTAGYQLGKKSKTSFKTRKFITARYWTVSWANWNQYTHTLHNSPLLVCILSQLKPVHTHSLFLPDYFQYYPPLHPKTAYLSDVSTIISYPFSWPSACCLLSVSCYLIWAP